jgi:hypothetical protein
MRQRLVLAMVAGVGMTILAGCSSDGGPSDDVIEVPDDEPTAQQPEPKVGTVQQAVTAPGCINRTLLDGHNLYLSSSCASTKWVKVILRYGSDSSCFSLDPGRIKIVSWPWPRSFDRLDSC